MIERALARAYERLGPRYPQRAVVLQIQLGYLVWLLTLAILAIHFRGAGFADVTVERDGVRVFREGRKQ